MSAVPDHPIGQVLFTDGITRTVYRSPDGLQYVLDSDGKPVPGTWIYPDDEADMPCPTLIVNP